MKLVLIENDLIGYQYAEPYAGGAAAALSLLFEGYVSHVHINDLDVGLASFWRIATNDAEWLCRRIADTPVTIDEWKRQRQVQSRADSSERDLAFSTFFLNRTNRSGILHGGVIGGLEQRGSYPMTARYNKPILIDRIERVACNKAKITVSQLDAVAFIDGMTTIQSQRTFFYLDPPYFNKGGDLYHNGYSLSDHQYVSARVRHHPGKWIVTYDATEPILSFYGGIDSLRYGVSYSAAERFRGSEVMFFSPSLRVPQVALPDKVPFSKCDSAWTNRQECASSI